MSTLSRPQEPSILAASRGRLEVTLAEEWRIKRSRGPEPDAVLQHPDLRAALLTMSRNTCAYCQSALDPVEQSGMVVVHHRPSWGAVGASGEVDFDAYWWLTYVWSNLYPACADCARTRGTRFPVQGDRAKSQEELASEQPLLLDPCADDPDDHLAYQLDGKVTAFSERGQATIEVFALNREALVRARMAALERGRSGTPDPDDTEFATLRTQVADHSTTSFPPPKTRSQPPLSPAPRSGSAAPPPRYDLGKHMAAAERTHYFGTVRWIERVVIENFRPIRDVEINLARSTSEHGPWTVLLGENGSGKSSVLQAIALTMIGGEQRRALGIDARKFLRHGARRGRVRVHLAGGAEPLELVWRKGDAEFSGPEPVPALLLGYGATRLLQKSTMTDADARVVRVDNLFDPLLPLTDPTAWLLSLDQDRFDDVAENISHLLALDGMATMARDDDQVFLQHGRSKSDIASLSDGYQSMLVLACDILRTVLTMWDSTALAEGIVLIDELGAHLHPRWRMRIVSALRQLMPRVQFIVTTHDPLCLRGVADGEVVVVRRNSGGDVVTIVDLPPIAGMRVDQLLTSEHFGLGSTDDPELDGLWSEYYRLKGKDRVTSAEAGRRDAVRARLDQLEQFGTTERDRLLLQSADTFIARRREHGDKAVPTSAEVTAELADLWSANLGGGAL